MELWLLGFDIGGTKCAAILGKTDGSRIEAVEKAVFATADFSSPYDCIKKFISDAETLLKKYPAVKPAALGISCGGPLDSNAGVILSPPNLPGWDEIPVCRILADHFHIPVKLCNDADACALAEWKFGAGRGSENMIFLTFGTGMGRSRACAGCCCRGRRGRCSRPRGRPRR